MNLDEYSVVHFNFDVFFCPGKNNGRREDKCVIEVGNCEKMVPTTLTEYCLVIRKV